MFHLSISAPIVPLSPVISDDFYLSDEDIAAAMNGAPLPRLCAQCGAGFFPRHSSQRFCKDGCRIRSRNARQRATGTLTYPKHGARRLSTIIADAKYRDSHNGQPMPADWVAHHRNGDTRDNRPENIVALSRADHLRLHAEDRRTGGALANRMARHRRGAIGVRATVAPSFTTETVPLAEMENETGSFNARRGGNAVVCARTGLPNTPETTGDADEVARLRAEWGDDGSSMGGDA